MRGKLAWVGLLVLGIAVIAVAVGRGLLGAPEPERVAAAPIPTPDGARAGDRQATFASGCFWCTEAVFQRLKGVHAVASGYTGGTVKNPTYDQVCAGITGHAEAVQVTYDPAVVSYPELL